MLSSENVLEKYFPEARARLIQLAAMLDRYERCGGSDDPRLDQLRQALVVLQSTGNETRAQRIQMIFSDPVPEP